MIFENIIKNIIVKCYLIKKIRITQIKEDTKSSLLKQLSYKLKNIIRIKYRELSAKSNNIK